MRPDRRPLVPTVIVRAALRSLRQGPGVSLAIVVTLALSVGVNSAVLAVLYDLVLRPLPFADQHAIVPVLQVTRGEALRYRQTAGWSDYQDFRAHADLFESFGVWRTPRAVVANGSSLTAVEVTPDLFDVLALQPIAGRLAIPPGTASGGLPSTVLVEGVWERQFGADPGVIGTTIELANEGPMTIVGVAPRTVAALDARVDLLILHEPKPGDPNAQRRFFGAGQLWARLKPGVSHASARAQLETLDRRWAETVATAGDRASYLASPRLRVFEQPNPLAPGLFALQAGAATVLLIGAINVGILLLGRFCLRAPDYSVHYTLGAGLGGLFRLAVAESLVLGATGAAAGAGLGWLALRFSNRYLRDLAPASQEVTLSLPVIVVGVTGTLAMAMAIGVLAMLGLWRVGLVGRLDMATRSTTAPARVGRFSFRLVVAQVALAFVLLIGAGLLGRSLTNVLAVAPGFDPTRVVVGQINLEGFVDRASLVATRERVESALELLPGVESVSTMGSYWPPVISKSENTANVAIRGRAPTSGDPVPEVLLLAVPPDFFATMGIPILDGRTCPPSASAPGRRLLVDRLFAERFLLGGRAVGTEVHLYNGPYRGPPPEWFRIVGVADRANLQGLETPDGVPIAYTCRDGANFVAFNVLVRTTRPVSAIIPEVQTTLAGIDPHLYLQHPGTYETHLNRLHVAREGLTGLMGVFAFLALVLSATGLVGILAYDVLHRRRDIAIRLAIGASRRDVVGWVLGRALGSTVAGLAIGVSGAVALSLYLRSLLFGVQPFDPWTYAGVGLLLCGVALVAGGAPVLRAIRIDPRESLAE